MQNTDNLMYGIFILVGMFSLAAACFNFEWFFNHRKAQLLVSWFGRTGARIFYGLLGLALIVCGILSFLGYIH